MASPGWRRPIGVTPWFAEHRARSGVSLREALYDVAGFDPMTAEDLRAAIREHWGPASDGAIDRARDALVRDGELVRVADGWVRADEESEDDEP